MSYSGAGGVWRTGKGDFVSVNKPGTYAGLQTALDEVAAAGGGEVVAWGDYGLASQTLNIPANTWFHGGGPGLRIYRASGNVNLLQNYNFVGTPPTDIVVSDMVLDGVGSTTAGMTGMRITNASRVLLRNVKVMGTVLGVAIYGNGTGASVNNDVTMEGCQFSGTYDAAIDAQDVSGLTVHGCLFRSIGHAFLNIEPNLNTEQVVGVSFVGNVGLGGTTTPFCIAVQGDHSASVQGIIRSCVFSGNAIDGGERAVFFGGSNLEGILFVGNAFTNQQFQSVYAISANGITTGVALIGNYISDASSAGVGTYSAVMLNACEKVTVVNNFIRDTRGTPQHKYAIEEAAGSTGNFIGPNLVIGTSVGAHSAITAPQRSYSFGLLNHQGGFAVIKNNLTYSAAISVDCLLGNYFKVTVTNGTAFQFNNPSGYQTGQELTFDIKNSSGGAMGAITWGARYALAGAFVNPANGKRRTITFYYDIDDDRFVEKSRAAADI